MADLAGEADRGALRLDFDRRLMLQFRGGAAITSDAGLLAYRELDDALVLTDTAAGELADGRTGKNGRHRLAGFLRQSIFGRLAGYEDVNDAERLCRDPAIRWVVGDRAITESAASASQMARFETKWLSRPENLAALADLSGQWIDKVHQQRPPRTIVLDMDSSESLTYGEQEGSAYNGHFGCTCYHPLFVFNQLGDVERCALRSGNVHSADGWRAVLEPVVARHRGVVKRLYFRDEAFANPEIYEFLEAEWIGYTIRLPANRALQDRIGYLLKRPIGRPPHEVRRYFAGFSYQEKSWKKPRRVVAKIEWHPSELHPASALCEKLIKIGAKVVSHGRYVTFQMAEVAVPRQMFFDILLLIARLRAPPAPDMSGPRNQMRPVTTGKVRLDAGQPACLGARRRPPPTMIPICSR
jgi:hypothetical protein